MSCISNTHLNRYLAEFPYRYNRRFKGRRETAFAGKTSPYNKIRLGRGTGVSWKISPHRGITFLCFVALMVIGLIERAVRKKKWPRKPLNHCRFFPKKTPGPPGTTFAACLERPSVATFYQRSSGQADIKMSARNTR